MSNLVDKVFSFIFYKGEFEEIEIKEPDLLSAEDAYLFYHWRMSKDDWKDLSNGGRYGNEDEKLYGSCTIGHLCAEICAGPDNEHIHTNLYVLGKDEGFGYTRSGVPYTLSDCEELDGFRLGDTFEEFKAGFEEMFTKVILKEPEFIDKALSVAGDWN